MASCALKIARFSGRLAIAPLLVTIFSSAIPSGATESQPVLRICADPNNLPFSNQRLEGFENKIAEIVAAELGRKIEYTWRAQRRGFFRETLKEDKCDLVLGVPIGFERALTTIPYYRSTYVFVYRRDKGFNIHSLDDPILRQLRVGVQLIGDDYANTPPAHALALRGIVTNVVGFTIYGNYAEENPPARIVEAAARGTIDVAVVWGPLAGFFARRQTSPLEIVPVPADRQAEYLRFSFAICMGVRKKDKELRDQLNSLLERNQSQIDRVLAAYGVPRISESAPRRPL